MLSCDDHERATGDLDSDSSADCASLADEGAVDPVSELVPVAKRVKTMSDDELRLAITTFTQQPDTERRDLVRVFKVLARPDRRHYRKPTSLPLAVNPEPLASWAPRDPQVAKLFLGALRDRKVRLGPSLCCSRTCPYPLVFPAAHRDSGDPSQSTTTTPRTPPSD